MVSIELTQGARAGELCAEMVRIYRAADQAMAVLATGCRQCGKCCDFGPYGHRLFCSALELLHLMASAAVTAGGGRPEAGAAYSRSADRRRGKWDAGPDPACPWLADGKCMVYTYRMLGCRTFTCDPRRADASREIHERCLADLKLCALRFDVPWIYGPLLQVAREIHSAARCRGPLT